MAAGGRRCCRGRGTAAGRRPGGRPAGPPPGGGAGGPLGGGALGPPPPRRHGHPGATRLCGFERSGGATGRFDRCRARVPRLARFRPQGVVQGDRVRSRRPPLASSREDSGDRRCNRYPAWEGAGRRVGGTALGGARGGAPPAGAQAAPPAPVQVIVQKLPAAGRGPELAVQRLRGRVTRALPLVAGFAATLPGARAVAELAATPGVRAVTPDRKVRVQAAAASTTVRAVYTRTVRADEAWGRGITGQGVTVALIDTGVASVPDRAPGGRRGRGDRRAARHAARARLRHRPGLLLRPPAAGRGPGLAARPGRRAVVVSWLRF